MILNEALKIRPIITSTTNVQTLSNYNKGIKLNTGRLAKGIAVKTIQIYKQHFHSPITTILLLK